MHGGFLGPWLWGDVQDLLAERGIDSVAPDLPSVATGGDLYADVAAVEAAIAESDVAVLCGHSYAGMVITETAARSGLPIRHLIYVAAAVPDSGQSWRLSSRPSGLPVTTTAEKRSWRSPTDASS